MIALKQYLHIEDNITILVYEINKSLKLATHQQTTS